MTNANIIGFGFACFFFTIPAYLFIDSWGRRPLLLISLGGTTLSLLALGAFFFIKDHELERALISSFTIVVFTFFYSIGAGPIPFTLSAEVFPLCFRGMCLSRLMENRRLILKSRGWDELQCDGQLLWPGYPDTWRSLVGIRLGWKSSTCEYSFPV